MALYAGTITPPSVVPTPVAAPALVGTFTPEWYAPDGTVLALNAEGALTFSLESVGGTGAAAVDFTTVPNIDGGVYVDAVRPKESTIAWPLRIRATTHMDFITELRRVTGLFTQTRRKGPGRLRLSRPDGLAREIFAYYQSGLEGDTSGDGGWLEASPVVSLLCPRPFWRSSEPVTIYAEERTNPPFLAPYMTVSSGAVFGDLQVVNPGVTDVWPQWQIQGPMTQLVATNVTRGETFTITHTLMAGEVLTMSARPVQIRGPAGENLINTLNLPAGKPWRLDAEATSQISFVLTGAAPATGGTPATSVTAVFYPEFEMS